MQRLCRITVPGLSVRRDFTAARRLLADFPDIHAVVATTAPGTLVVLSAGSEDVHAGLDTLESIATQDAPVISRLLRWSGGLTGDDSAA